MQEINELEAKVNSMQKSLDEANNSLQGIMMGVEKLQGKGKETETLAGHSTNSRLHRTNITPIVLDLPKKLEKGNSSGINSFKRPKVILAKFNGENPREWIKKCQRYFLLDPVMEEEKMLFASLHLEGAAETWFGNFF